MIPALTSVSPMLYQNTTLIALDPGTRQMGYAGFHDEQLLEFGVKTFRKESGVTGLLSEVERLVTRLVIERKPETLVLEKNNFSQIRQNVRLALVTGRIRSVARKRRIRLIELDVRTIRKAVTGDGNATKRETARTVAIRDAELRAYLKSSHGWRLRYYMNMIDAVACGRAFQILLSNGDRRVTRQARNIRSSSPIP